MSASEGAVARGMVYALDEVAEGAFATYLHTCCVDCPWWEIGDEESDCEVGM